MADADDPLKTAGRFFKRLGSTLGPRLAETARAVGKQVGPTAGAVGKQLVETGRAVGKQLEHTGKQVTGLGRGAVRVELDDLRLVPGGTVHGRLVLALTEPVEARRVVVTLRARQRYVAIKRGEGDRGLGATYAPVYEQVQELAPAGTYHEGTYAFALEIPPEALDMRAQPPAGGSPLAEVARTVTSTLTPGDVEWHVVGALEIRLGRDLATEVELAPR